MLMISGDPAIIRYTIESTGGVSCIEIRFETSGLKFEGAISELQFFFRECNQWLQ